MGVTKLQSRSFLRNMVRSRIIAKYMNDIGRQRITKYVSKKFEKSSKMSKQFNKEIHRIKELTKKITSKNEKNLKNKAISQAENDKHPANHEDDQTSQKSCSDYHVDKIDIDASVIDQDKNEEKDKYADANYAKKETELKNLFYIVNRILHKYELSKFRSKYKCTTSKSLLKMKMKSSDTNAKEKKAKLDVLSTSIQQIVNDAKATSFYNSIKTNLIAQKPVRSGTGASEVFGFMEFVQNSEKKSTNITYRFVQTCYKSV